MQYALSSYTCHTTSFFRRMDDVREFVANTPEFYKVSDVGDEPTVLYYGYLGNTFYIDRPMSCYRLFSEGSWSSRRKNDIKMYLENLTIGQKMYALFNIYSDFQYNYQIAYTIETQEMRKHSLLHSPRDHAKYLLKKENRWYLKHSNKKAIIAVVLQARAPWLLGLYNRLIGQK